MQIEDFENITSSIKGSPSAVIFWLSFFKNRRSILATDFFDKINLLSAINQIQEIDLVQKVFYDQITWDNFIIGNDYEVSAINDAEVVVKMIENFDVLANLDDNTVGTSMLRS